ncbi:alpha-2,3-sialyltransferase, partial [Campylobacter jejuni]|nr:alpha-2,3-sialyltransferase [Campylobacter jejuni]
MIINNNKITIVKQSNEIQNNQNTIKIYCEKINSQNNIILQQTNQIHNLNETLNSQNNIILQQTNQIHNLNTTLENKNQLLIAKQNLLKFQNNYGKAKIRIQNQLSYKLGQALILNSKSVFGFLSLPFIILSIVISHKQEQK